MFHSSNINIPSKEYIDQIKSLPSLEEIKKRLYQIPDLVKNLNTNEEIAEVINKQLIINYPYISVINNLDDATKNVVYRARKNLGDLDITNPSTFSYPPLKAKAKTLGRFTVNGVSAFYASYQPNISLLETDFKVNEVVYIGEWSVRKDNNFLTVLFFPKYIHPESVGVEIREKIIKEEIIIYKAWGLNKEAIEKLSFIRETIADFLGTDDYPYKITSNLCSNMLKAEEKVDSIVYSSVKSKHTNVCIVYNSRVVDTHLRLKKVYKIIVDSYNENTNQISVRFLSTGVVNQNYTIDWRNACDIDKKLFKFT